MRRVREIVREKQFTIERKRERKREGEMGKRRGERISRYDPVFDIPPLCKPFSLSVSCLPYEVTSKWLVTSFLWRPSVGKPPTYIAVFLLLLLLLQLLLLLTNLPTVISQITMTKRE